MDGGDAGAQGDGARRQRRLFHFILARRRDARVERVEALLGVKAGAFIAGAALRFAHQRQRGGVDDGRMAADPRDDDRAGARDAVQIGACREAALGQLVLIEAMPLNPAVRLSFPKLGQSRQNLLDAGAANQVRLLKQLEAEGEQVDVGIDESG